MTGALTEWAKNAPSDDFWRVVIFLVLVSVICFFCSFYYLLRKRIIQDTPTSRIRSAAQGYVELSGRSEQIQNQVLTAPLTNTICTWYTYKIEEYRRTGKRTSWLTVENKTSESFFLLIDDTGTVVIDPEGANVTPSSIDVWYGSYRRPDNIQNRETGISLFSLMGRRYRYTEQRIHPGDPLYAMGLFSTTGGARQTLNVNDELRELLGEWKQDSASLLKKFDVNQDKQIDMEEWSEVRKAALKQVQERHREMQSLPPVNMLGCTHDMRRPFLLSAVPEKELVKKYVTYSSVCITGFFITGILATFLISSRLAG